MLLSCAYIELWMHLGSLGSTLAASVALQTPHVHPWLDIRTLTDQFFNCTYACTFHSWYCYILSARTESATQVAQVDVFIYCHGSRLQTLNKGACLYNYAWTFIYRTAVTALWDQIKTSSVWTPQLLAFLPFLWLGDRLVTSCASWA